MIEMRLKVEFGVSEELRGLVREVLDNSAGTPETPEPEETPEAPEPDEAPQPEAEAKEEAPAPQEKAQPEEAAPETPEPATAETPAGAKPEEAQPEVTPPTDQEMRDMMDITISRLAGNGWAESRDAGVVMIRKGCTKRFKEIARHLGAERPTALQGEARVKFLAHLEEIYVNKGTGEVEWMAF